MLDNLTDTALDIRNLGKSFGATEVLRDISVAIAPGDFLVLVGPSGCGKSTLLNCIAGLEEVTTGSIAIAGRDVTREPPRDRDIAMVFQSYALYPTMSVAENIGFGMKVRRMPKPAIDAKVDEVGRLLQIDHLLDRRPSQLSGGQRQRVAMGRALVRDPALFLFDEPLSNLDAKLRVEMRAEIKRLHQQTGTSIVYVTHDQIEAMTLATKIVVLKDGQIQQVGSPDDIYLHPANTFVADFMGSPPMNLFPAHVDRATGTARFGPDAQVSLPALPAALPADGNVIVGARPEDFRPGDGFSVTPRLVEKTGADVFVYFELSGKPVSARLSGRHGAVTGDIGLSLDTAHLCFFHPDSGQRLA